MLLLSLRHEIMYLQNNALLNYTQSFTIITLISTYLVVSIVHQNHSLVKIIPVRIFQFLHHFFCQLLNVAVCVMLTENDDIILYLCPSLIPTDGLWTNFRSLFLYNVELPMLLSRQSLYVHIFQFKRKRASIYFLG